MSSTVPAWLITFLTSVAARISSDTAPSENYWEITSMTFMSWNFVSGRPSWEPSTSDVLRPMRRLHPKLQRTAKALLLKAGKLNLSWHALQPASSAIQPTVHACHQRTPRISKLSTIALDSSQLVLQAFLTDTLDWNTRLEVLNRLLLPINVYQLFILCWCLDSFLTQVLSSPRYLIESREYVKQRQCLMRTASCDTVLKVNDIFENVIRRLLSGRYDPLPSPGLVLGVCSSYMRCFHNTKKGPY